MFLDSSPDDTLHTPARSWAGRVLLSLEKSQEKHAVNSIPGDIVVKHSPLRSAQCSVAAVSCIWFRPQLINQERAGALLLLPSCTNLFSC